MDDARLLAASSLLVPYGDTLPTEGKTPWDEVVEVARKKVDQYRPDSPNVLVVYSCSANCIDETVIPTAIATSTAAAGRIRETVSGSSTGYCWSAGNSMRAGDYGGCTTSSAVCAR
jgi:hypothetical protein